MSRKIINKTTAEVAAMLEAEFDKEKFPRISYILGSDWGCGYNTDGAVNYYNAAVAAFHLMYGYVTDEDRENFEAEQQDKAARRGVAK